MIHGFGIFKPVNQKVLRRCVMGLIKDVDEIETAPMNSNHGERAEHRLLTPGTE